MKSRIFDQQYREIARNIIRENLEFDRLWADIGMKGKHGIVLLDKAANVAGAVGTPARIDSPFPSSAQPSGDAVRICRGGTN